MNAASLRRSALVPRGFESAFCDCATTDQRASHERHESLSMTVTFAFEANARVSG